MPVPTPMVIVVVAAFSVSALILAVCAAGAFGQGVTVQLLEAVAALFCLANAADVALTDRVSIKPLLWFAAPAAALWNLRRVRRVRRLKQEQLARAAARYRRT